MNELKIIILIITFTTTWADYALPMLKGRLDFKPFNCTFCLSIWISILFCFVWGGWFVLSTPLFLRIVERKLL